MRSTYLYRERMDLRAAYYMIVIFEKSKIVHPKGTTKTQQMFDKQEVSWYIVSHILTLNVIACNIPL